MYIKCRILIGEETKNDLHRFIIPVCKVMFNERDKTAVHSQDSHQGCLAVTPLGAPCGFRFRKRKRGAKEPQPKTVELSAPQDVQ